jgi:hypothetical protein
MATPGYIGSVLLLPSNALPPASTFPAIGKPPPWAPSDIPSPAPGMFPGSPQAAEMRLHICNIEEDRKLENTTPTGNYGRELNTNTGYGAGGDIEADFPYPGDPFETDLPDLENALYLFLDAIVDGGTPGVQPPAPTAFFGPRSRRFKAWCKIASVAPIQIDAQGVAKYRFRVRSHGPYYLGRNQPG